MRHKGSFPAEAFLENTNNSDLYGLHGTRMLAHIQQHVQMFKNSEILYALFCNHAFKKWRSFTSIHPEGKKKPTVKNHGNSFGL